ncbi:lambda exonuclease family protein [Pseudomonas sp. PS02290]|jgi:hypothetical protein|uniref:lambda exonuclease family protein n=1 Tax=Pseudomonas sp. PS02290 TaxID=2991430 RepID=UPI00249B0782|nr:lambda exonuclease family protein [Pseudomonas sp. PS02290]
MQIITNVEQGTQEWLNLRLGIATASEFECLMVNGKGEGGFGVGAFTYMDTLIGERITGEAADPFGGNRHTERGHELESVARDLYRKQCELETSDCGIILNHNAGYSPDSLVGADGLAEVKTKLPKFQVSVILQDEVPKDHVAQCQGGLWLAEREWIDFVSFWPGMPLFIKRMYRDEAYIRKLAQKLKDFYEILEERERRVLGIAA